MAPPMYDTSNIDVWKVKMSMYLKTLGMHVYLATAKKSYLGNDKLRQKFVRKWLIVLREG